ncbi:MAG TPA: PVC-type heme-binding CxxCH protein [Opitutaceae bacterium]|nr:PVC-type heme-binding CxxCH protein [Opitutaceae bacterium]
MKRLWLFLALPLAALAQVGLTPEKPDVLPTAPEGFTIQLFAREPAVRNPCAMAFDARGRLFVGQGPQYRNPKPDTPGDTVVMLVDSDGDGVAETAKTFATGLNCVQGLAWHGRDLWVANSPDLTIVRDLDGDDVADEYVRVYTDLGNIEHGVHGLNWAPDGKLYMSKGNSKGLSLPGRIAPKPFRELWDVTAPPGSPDFPPPRTFKRADYKNAYQDPTDDWGRMGGILRCDDLGANLEIVSRGYRNPWDIGFDSGFNWLGTDNDQSEGDRIFMSFPGANFGWAHGWSTHWTGEGHLPTVPISGKVFTGSGTGIVFADTATLPPAFRGVWFINDFLHRTTFVYRPRWEGALLQPEGGKWQPFIQGGRALFNPVDIEVGPDGALYITGWGVKLGADYEDGKQINEGRVFRVAPSGLARTKAVAAKRAKPVAQWSFAELAEDLGGAIPAWRIDAQDELVRRGGAVKAELIANLTRGGLTTAQETWTLWTLGRLEPHNRAIDEWFAQKGRTLSPNALLQSIRILAHRIREWQPAAKLPAFVAEALRDAEPRVRFETIQAIGRAKQAQLTDAVLEVANTETDRVTFYAAWHTLQDIMPLEAIRAKLDDARAGVRRAALLALLERGALDEAAVRTRLKDADPATAELAALWVAKHNGNPLIVIEPAPGEFTDSVRLKLTPGLKPGTVRYTLDGSEPTLATRNARDDLVFRETTTMKVALFVDGKKVGPTATGTWRKRVPSEGETVTLTPPTEPTTLAAVLPLLKNGDAKRGRAIFSAAGCVACHAVGMEGGVFGPDLTDLGERGNVERLVRSILEPNAEITEGFGLLNVALKDGKTYSGRLQEETGRQLAIMQADGQIARLTKADIAKRESLHTSPMPPYERVLAPQVLADLVTWLSGERKVAPEKTGALRPAVRASAAAFAVEMKENSFAITDGGRPVAEYVFKDAETLRPHLRNLFAPDGARITRNHPPLAGEPSDHATMHPGAWFAFGSINGEDFWRNKGRVEHERFLAAPEVRDGVLRFMTSNRLVSAGGQTIASQVLRYAISRQGDAYLFICETTLRSDAHDLVFGEQEEMGFGVRLATPLIEKNGGKIVNNEGRTTAKATWGRVADYCSYSHTVDGRVIGAAIFASPANPRRSWWHTRDYGLMVANPFGKRVLPEGSDGNLTVKRGDELTLRFGLLLFSAAAIPDLAATYREFASGAAPQP